MKINHESPLNLLEDSLLYNDYQYILPLFWENEIYQNFMINYSKTKDAFTIVDNGLFEGEIPDNHILINIVNKVRADIFIVPDVWNDHIGTCVNAKSWMRNFSIYLPRKTNLMAVVQAETFDKAIDCYINLSSLGYTHIAFNHAGSFYLDLVDIKTDNNLLKLMYGRQRFINYLKNNKIINKDIHHHLLGATLPAEFSYYANDEYNFIKTIDTSNPVIYGLEYGKYPKIITTKPENKLEHYFYNEVTENQKEHVLYNVKYFRTLLS
jgi:hypothetical protein